MEHQNKPRLLVDSILVEPDVQPYLYRLKNEKCEVFKHSLNVAYLVAEICYSQIDTEEHLKLDKKEANDIIRGALLHDIGKLSIPSKILNKKEKLTKKEIELIRNHPLAGYNMIKDNDFLSDTVKDIVLHHHEKLDGTGYPDGLKRIKSATQIVAFCDMYDALTEARSYRPKKTIFTAYQILNKECLDSDLFLLLASCIDR